MDTRQLTAFCTVVERRSFSQAAERLGVTQPAVSLRILALEEQLVSDVASTTEGELAGDLVLGASTGPAAIVVPMLLGEFHREHPDVRVFLTVSDTHTIIERVAARELELGIVGDSRRHRGVRFEPFFSDQVILACPPGHRFADGTVTLEE